MYTNYAAYTLLTPAASYVSFYFNTFAPCTLVNSILSFLYLRPNEPFSSLLSNLEKKSVPIGVSNHALKVRLDAADLSRHIDKIMDIVTSCCAAMADKQCTDSPIFEALKGIKDAKASGENRIDAEGNDTRTRRQLKRYRRDSMSPPKIITPEINRFIETLLHPPPPIDVIQSTATPPFPLPTLPPRRPLSCPLLSQWITTWRLGGRQEARKFYKGVLISGQPFRMHDTVFVYTEEVNLASIARIEYFFEDEDRVKKVHLMMFQLVDHTWVGKGTGPLLGLGNGWECFVRAGDCGDHRVEVLHGKVGITIGNGVKRVREEDVFFCRCVDGQHGLCGKHSCIFWFRGQVFP